MVGFAAETETVEQNAADKRSRKGCDWILANEVSDTLGFGTQDNKVTLISKNGSEPWPLMPKQQVAEQLVSRIAAFFKEQA